MNTLSKNWFVEDLIDFEYKKYLLLAYLEHVKKDFNNYLLYPSLADLVSHYRNLLHFKTSSEKLRNELHGDLKDIDWENLQPVYEDILENDELMSEIEEIVSYSIPEIKGRLDQGKSLWDAVEYQMNINPIGLVPLYKNEGYLLLKTNEIYETHVYEYRISIFERSDEKYRGIHTEYINTYKNSLVNTFEAIKSNLVKENKKFPNPATYLIESEKNFPIKETMLPIASRLLVRYIYLG